MEKNYDIKKTLKNSLKDILDIRNRNIRTEFFENYENLKKDSEMRIKLKIKLSYEEMDKIQREPFLELTKYMHKLFVYFNYSPIIDKLFPIIKKENEEKIQTLNHTWIYYNCEANHAIKKTKSDTYAKKILHIYVSFINDYLKHIFSIPKVADCLNILNNKINFKIYNFEDETEKQDIYLNVERELKGNGCTFIVLKELRRLYDCLNFGKHIFIRSIFRTFFHGAKNIIDNIFYNYVIENEVVSSLLFQIRLIFDKFSSNNKEVVDFINKFTIELKNDLNRDKYEKKIDDIYNNPEFKERVPGFEKEYDEIDKYNLDIMPQKVKYIYKEIKDLEKDYKLNGDEIEYEEDEKIKEIKDLDELTKYIQGEPKKKKNKKKKKKENLINMLKN